jgi:hypothetical protein
MEKQIVYQEELAKLFEIFKEVEPAKMKLVQGLIQDAAFLFSENCELKQSINKTGMVKIHPQHEDIQKLIPTAAQYLKNLNSYSVVIKTLNSVLSNNTLEGEDEFDAYIKERREKKEG